MFDILINIIHIITALGAITFMGCSMYHFCIAAYPKTDKQTKLYHAVFSIMYGVVALMVKL